MPLWKRCSAVSLNMTVAMISSNSSLAQDTLQRRRLEWVLWHTTRVKLWAKNGMGWKGRRMGRKRSDSLASDFRHTRSNEDESGESRREGGGWHSLLFGSGIYATLLNPRQDYGSDHDEEEHTENGPTFNPEPEENPRTILELCPAPFQAVSEQNTSV